MRPRLLGTFPRVLSLTILVTSLSQGPALAQALEDAAAVQDQLSRVWLNVRTAQMAQPTTTAATVPVTAAVRYSLPSGTHALVRLTTWLSSKNAQVDDRFSALSTDPIYSGSSIAIPAGAVFEGFVSEVDPAGRASDAGTLLAEKGQDVDLP